MATTMTGPTTPFRERIRIEELDRLARIAEDTNRVAALISEDLGYERVRINHVHSGAQLRVTERGSTKWLTVVKNEHRTDEVSSWFSVLFDCDEHGAVVKTYDDGEFVSRLLPITEEPF